MSNPARRPAWNLKQVFARRGRVQAALEAGLAGGRDADALEGAAEAAFRVLAGHASSYAAVYQSVAALADPAASVRDAAWALAGNTAKLKAGRPVFPGDWPAEATEVPVQVTAVRRGRRKGRQAILVRAKVLAGPGCPHTLTVRWTEKSARYFAGHPEAVGLSGDQSTRYRHPYQLVGCRFLMHVRAAPGGPTSERVGGTAAFREHNQSLARMRLRDGFACPHDYTHACHECHVGQTGCPAATHEHEWVQVVCNQCAGRAPADLAWDRRVCLPCLEKAEL